MSINIFMKILFSLMFCLLLAGCVTPSNPEAWMEREKNACLPTAIAFREGLKKYQVWSEVVAYQYWDTQKQKRSGHAIVAYLYPPGKNQLWTYDYLGSYRVRAFINDPLTISQIAENLRGRPYNRVDYAEFLK
jgi:hypothetical protein